MIAAAAAMSCCDVFAVVVVNILVVEWTMFLAQMDPFDVGVPNGLEVAYEVLHPTAHLISMPLWAQRNEAAAAIVEDVLEVEEHHEKYGYPCIPTTTYSPLRPRQQETTRKQI